jgi:hypothetical protein
VTSVEGDYVRDCAVQNGSDVICFHSRIRHQICNHVQDFIFVKSFNLFKIRHLLEVAIAARTRFGSQVNGTGGVILA